MSNKVVVRAHGPCNDGAGALYLASLEYPNADFGILSAGCNPVEEQQLIEDAQEADLVYLLDVVPSNETILSLCKIAIRVVLIDHHATNKDRINAMTDRPENLQIIFDMSTCAADLTARHFKILDRIPDLAEFIKLLKIQDCFLYGKTGDLVLERRAKAFAARFRFLNWELNPKKNPELFQMFLKIDIEQIIADGVKMLEDDEKRVAEIVTAVTATKTIEVDGVEFTVMYVRPAGPDMRLLSDIGVGLAMRAVKMHPDKTCCGAVISKSKTPGKETVVLRSIAPVNCSLLAKHFGGGGHPQACGCDVEQNFFP